MIEVYPDYYILKNIKDEVLRRYARDLGIQIGRNKRETITNIILSRKALVGISLLIPMPEEET